MHVYNNCPDAVKQVLRFKFDLVTWVDVTDLFVVTYNLHGFYGNIASDIPVWRHLRQSDVTWRRLRLYSASVTSAAVHWCIKSKRTWLGLDVFQFLSLHLEIM